MPEKKPSCFGIKFNLLKKCKTCKYLRECGEAWIRQETENLTKEIVNLPCPPVQTILVKEEE